MCWACVEHFTPSFLLQVNVKDKFYQGVTAANVSVSFSPFTRCRFKLARLQGKVFNNWI